MSTQLKEETRSEQEPVDSGKDLPAIKQWVLQYRNARSAADFDRLYSCPERFSPDLYPIVKESVQQQSVRLGRTLYEVATFAIPLSIVTVAPQEHWLSFKALLPSLLQRFRRYGFVDGSKGVAVLSHFVEHSKLAMSSHAQLRQMGQDLFHGALLSGSAKGKGGLDDLAPEIHVSEEEGQHWLRGHLVGCVYRKTGTPRADWRSAHALNAEIAALLRAHFTSSVAGDQVEVGTMMPLYSAIETSAIWGARYVGEFLSAEGFEDCEIVFDTESDPRDLSLSVYSRSEGLHGPMAYLQLSQSEAVCADALIKSLQNPLGPCVIGFGGRGRLPH